MLDDIVNLRMACVKYKFIWYIEKKSFKELTNIIYQILKVKFDSWLTAGDFFVNLNELFHMWTVDVWKITLIVGVKACLLLCLSWVILKHLVTCYFSQVYSRLDLSLVKAWLGLGLTIKVNFKVCYLTKTQLKLDHWFHFMSLLLWRKFLTPVFIYLFIYYLPSCGKTGHSTIQ